MIELRDYQKEAKAEIIAHLDKEGNDLVVLPTGSGKSIVIAEAGKYINRPVLILQPSKEILEQNVAKLAMYVSESEIGIYSASVGRKDINKYTFATIQSIYKKPEDFMQFKHVLMDEAHGYNPKDSGSMLTKFLKQIGNPKVIGFTATPYRNMNGYHKTTDAFGNQTLEVEVTLKLICRVKPAFWTRIIYNVNNFDLVKKGYLTRLKYIHADVVKHKDIPLNKSRSDFDLEKYEAMVQDKKARIMRGILWAQENHKSVLVFCSSVSAAERYSAEVAGSACISAKSSKEERSAIITGFKAGTIKTVFNVGVLTTGFDHPALDCIILTRPTRSLALYYQMLGRGVRIAEGKERCTVIDFTSTVKNLGRIETIQLKKPYLWELYTETGSWHGRALYRYSVDLEKK